MATRSSTPAWRTQWTEEPGRLQSMELQTIGHNRAINCMCTHIICIRLHVCLAGEWFKIVPCCSVTKSCPILCNPMDCSTPGFPVPHHLLEFAQVHVHCICDAIQPSLPLMPSSLSALNLSQHQELFQSQLFTSDDQNTGVSASYTHAYLSIHWKPWVQTHTSIPN